MDAGRTVGYTAIAQEEKAGGLGCTCTRSSVVWKTAGSATGSEARSCDPGMQRKTISLSESLAPLQHSRRPCGPCDHCRAD